MNRAKVKEELRQVLWLTPQDLDEIRMAREMEEIEQGRRPMRSAGAPLEYSIAGNGRAPRRGTRAC